MNRGIYYVIVIVLCILFFMPVEAKFMFFFMIGINKFRSKLIFMTSKCKTSCFKAMKMKNNDSRNTKAVRLTPTRVNSKTQSKTDNINGSASNTAPKNYSHISWIHKPIFLLWRISHRVFTPKEMTGTETL